MQRWLELFNTTRHYEYNRLEKGEHMKSLENCRNDLERRLRSNTKEKSGSFLMIPLQIIGMRSVALLSKLTLHPYGMLLSNSILHLLVGEGLKMSTGT